jgi:hypothetical protein
MTTKKRVFVSLDYDHDEGTNAGYLPHIGNRGKFAVLHMFGTSHA